MESTQFCTCPHCNNTVVLKGCYNCRHYVAHYVKWHGHEGYSQLSEGHCVTPRCKPKKAASVACDRWEAIEQKG